MWIELEKTTRRTRWPIWPIVFGLVWLALVAAMRFVCQGPEMGIVLCPLKRMVGMPCPTCGTTRSALSFLSGDPIAAILYNPLVFVAAAMLVMVLLVRLVFARRVRLHIPRRQRIGAWVLFAALLLGNWAYVICAGR